MGSQKNVDRLLDQNFNNFNFLPNKILLEDIDLGLFNAIKDFNLSLLNERNENRKVPVIWTTQELWAERKQNFGSLENENGTEIGRPFMALYRNAIKAGTSPNKFTIPRNKKFKYLKVPNFDGTLKGLDIYKIPQPVYVDIEYELVFETHYQQHVNKIYELIEITTGDRQMYLKINGYDIASMFDDATENNTLEINSEMTFQIVFPIRVLGKLVDPTNFEKVQSITKIAINIVEKK